MYRLSVAAVLAAFLLAGCERAGLIAQEGIERGRAAKDVEARVLIDSTCALGIGAWNRLDNPNEKIGTLLLCGGDVGGLRDVQAGSVKVEIN